MARTVFNEIGNILGKGEKFWLPICPPFPIRYLVFFVVVRISDYLEQIHFIVLR